MKFYVYISDAKIDMLLPQVPHDVKKKVATEIGIDLKILTAKRTAETESEDDRITRLEAVVTFIREYGNTGTVDDPDEYIDDTLPMRWGPYGEGFWAEGPKSPVVYFGGQTEKTVVGLGGSVQHVIGNIGTSSAHSHSATPYLLSYLKANLPGSHLASDKASSGAGACDLDAVDLATTQMDGPLQSMEFLAKRLLCGPNFSGKQVLLGSPLYVALAE